MGLKLHPFFGKWSPNKVFEENVLGRHHIPHLHLSQVMIIQVLMQQNNWRTLFALQHRNMSILAKVFQYFGAKDK